MKSTEQVLKLLEEQAVVCCKLSELHSQLVIEKSKEKWMNEGRLELIMALLKEIRK